MICHVSKVFSAESAISKHRSRLIFFVLFLVFFYKSQIAAYMCQSSFLAFVLQTGCVCHCDKPRRCSGIQGLCGCWPSFSSLNSSSRSSQRSSIWASSTSHWVSRTLARSVWDHCGIKHSSPWLWLRIEISNCWNQKATFSVIRSSEASFSFSLLA